MKELRERLKRHMEKRTEFHLVPFKDVNGENTPFSETEIQLMVEILETTGRYDVVRRHW